MPFAVKIGEIHVQSDKPISMEDRERIMKLFAKRNAVIMTVGDLEVCLHIPQPGDGRFSR